MGFKDGQRVIDLASWRKSRRETGKPSVSPEYVRNPRQEAIPGSKSAITIAAVSASGMAGVGWNKDVIRSFANEEVDELREKVMAQGTEYRRLLAERLEAGSLLDFLFLGGESLSDVLQREEEPFVKNAFAAAWPDLAAGVTFAEAVQACRGGELVRLLTGVKGKIFESEYVCWLNEGILPEGYQAQLVQLSKQGEREIVVRGPDSHVAELFRLKAADSVGHVKKAMELYPDIDVLFTIETYSQLIMNVAASEMGALGGGGERVPLGIPDDGQVSKDGSKGNHSVIILALGAFSAYTPKGAVLHAETRHVVSRPDLAGLIGGVNTLGRNWWPSVLAGVGSRCLAGQRYEQRKFCRELRKIKLINRLIIDRLGGDWTDDI
ncbi:hypothetical protein [Geobacter anodireducens]